MDVLQFHKKIKTDPIRKNTREEKKRRHEKKEQKAETTGKEAETWKEKEITVLTDTMCEKEIVRERKCY